MNQAPVKIRRKFDDTFKREAVQNWLSSGKSADIIAPELGLNSNLLYVWKKRFAPADAGGEGGGGAKPGSPADLQYHWLTRLYNALGFSKARFNSEEDVNEYYSRQRNLLSEFGRRRKLRQFMDVSIYIITLVQIVLLAFVIFKEAS